VVISDQVIYYDARRETDDGPVRRGQDQATSAVLKHRLNDFELAYGNTIPLPAGGLVRFVRGPIGSGDAVVTDASSDIRGYLRAYNEKTLAVETEAAGVARAFYEEIGHHDELRGWLTIRGISDRADHAKGHGYHELASQNAAAVLAGLISFLEFTARP
jgi:adenosylhomocysteine nucleosidase